MRSPSLPPATCSQSMRTDSQKYYDVGVRLFAVGSLILVAVVGTSCTDHPVQLLNTIKRRKPLALRLAAAVLPPLTR